jgi:cytochrome c oxidase assembly protein subunit 15
VALARPDTTERDGRGPSDGRRPGRAWPTVSPTLFRRMALASFIMMVLIVITGAAVRLTGSGLGCPDWPSCYHRRLTAQLSFHPLIEFGNRMVTVVLVVVVAATLLAALRRRPFRADLAWLSGGLVAGVIAQAVLGGIVVYTKLNPYLVMVHFLLSMLLVVNAVVLLHRCPLDYTVGSGTRLVSDPMLWLAKGELALLTLVVAAGTATTGAGPHAGEAAGQLVAKRIPIALRDMAELHSSLALLLVGVTIAMAVALHAMDVPERVRRAARILVLVLVAQAVIGYTQYFTHLPALLVELHVIGATAIVIGSVQFLLALTRHPPERLAAAPGAGASDRERAAADVEVRPQGASIKG